jgi:hypothetical protein
MGRLVITEQIMETSSRKRKRFWSRAKQLLPPEATFLYTVSRKRGRFSYFSTAGSLENGRLFSHSISPCVEK